MVFFLIVKCQRFERAEVRILPSSTRLNRKATVSLQTSVSYISLLRTIRLAFHLGPWIVFRLVARATRVSLWQGNKYRILKNLLLKGNGVAQKCIARRKSDEDDEIYQWGIWINHLEMIPENPEIKNRIGMAIKIGARATRYSQMDRRCM